MKLPLIVGALVLVGSMESVVAAPPPNDDIEDATLIGTLPFEDQTNLRGATAQKSDPDNCVFESPATTIWYEYTAASDQSIDVSASDDRWPIYDDDGSYWPFIAVYSGTPRNLSFESCAEEDSGSNSTRFQAVAGQRYFIVVDQDYWPKPYKGSLPTEVVVETSPPPTTGELTVVGEIVAKRKWTFYGDIYIPIPVQDIGLVVSVTCESVYANIAVDMVIEQGDLSYPERAHIDCVNGVGAEVLHFEEPYEPRFLLENGTASVTLTGYEYWSNYSAQSGPQQVEVKVRGPIKNR